jgi:hypothetical protein
MLDRELFGKTFTMLCEVYNRQPTGPLMEAYYMVLKNMEPEAFRNSVVSLMANRSYQSLPKPAEILEYSKPNVEALAILAIEDIERAISKAGAYASPTFQDIVVNSVIDAIGGWVHVCKMSADEWKWAKKEIPKLYGIHVKRDSHPDHVIGLVEVETGKPDACLVRASYQLPEIEVVKALNPSMDAIKQLSESKRVT